MLGLDFGSEAGNRALKIRAQQRQTTAIRARSRLGDGDEPPDRGPRHVDCRLTRRGLVCRHIARLAPETAADIYELAPRTARRGGGCVTTPLRPSVAPP